MARVSPSSDSSHVAREFDQRIVKPIRSRLGAATKVYLSPDGSLNLVPFSAAMDDDGRFLLSKYSFYLTSGREFLIQSVIGTGKPLIFADPDFGPTSGTNEFRNEVRAP
jgi:hypothetical protein